MSTRSIWRVACDAPSCPATDIIETITGLPDGWRRISSDDHLAGWQPRQRIRSSVTGRSHIDQRSRWDIHAAVFCLHLCPEHPDVFDAHLPRTEGAPMGARERERRVQVACSCGDLLTTTKDIRWVSGDPMPNGQVERVWWRHLPAELREYATRGRTPAVA